MTPALALLLAARVALGIHDGWGAFRDDRDGRGVRCYALAAPVRTAAGPRGRPFASVATRFGRDRRNAIFVRLGTVRSLAAPVTVSIGERRFTLSANDIAAWAPDAATDRAIVAAMRGSRSMSIESVTPAGRPFADVYALPGAATAIDAAALGCGPTR